MSDYRLPNSDERRLIRELMKRSRRPEAFLEYLDSLLVQQMDDGGMGSMRLLIPSNPDASRTMKSQASELQFIDSDGDVVIASLYVSEDGLPFEVDVWKPSFASLISIPNEFTDVAYGRDPDESATQ